MRHHERGFAFVIDGSDAPTDTYGLLLRYRSRCRPRQFLSSAVPFENGQDVLRRVRSRRADVPGSLRAGFPEEAPRRRPTGGLGHRTMHVLRLLPLEVGLVEDRPRTRAHRSPSRDHSEAGPVGTRHIHARRPRGGREQPLADRQGARAVRGSAVRPRLPSPRADQAVSLRFVPEAARPVFRRRPASPGRRPRTHAARDARRANVRDRPRGPSRGSGGLHIVDRGSPRWPGLYLSKNALGKALARELSESLGGIVSSSPKLFGQKQGREVYRVTSLVRLGPFHIGDVVRYKESLAEVTSVRPFVILRDLSTGESRRFKPKDVRSAKRV